MQASSRHKFWQPIVIWLFGRSADMQVTCNTTPAATHQISALSADSSAPATRVAEAEQKRTQAVLSSRRLNPTDSAEKA